MLKAVHAFKNLIAYHSPSARLVLLTVASAAFLTACQMEVNENSYEGTTKSESGNISSSDGPGFLYNANELRLNSTVLWKPEADGQGTDLFCEQYNVTIGGWRR